MLNKKSQAMLSITLYIKGTSDPSLTHLASFKPIYDRSWLVSMMWWYIAVEAGFFQVGVK